MIYILEISCAASIQQLVKLGCHLINILPHEIWKSIAHSHVLANAVFDIDGQIAGTGCIQRGEFIARW
jgi:hypothetical protein